MRLLSIITVNLNNVIGLEKTIESVTNQGFTNYEFIIIDGGSTDGSVEIIKKYADKLTWWISEKDSGIYNAMNKGILKSQGDYCLFLNSGDWLYHSNVLTECFNLNLKEDVIYGHQLIQQENNFVEDGCLDVKYLSFGALMKYHIPHQCTFIKRELFTKFGLYDENYRIVSDWLFMVLCACRYNCTFRRIDNFISVFDKTGLSNNPNFSAIQSQERKKALQKYFPLFITDYENFEEFRNKKYIKITMFLVNIFRKLKIVCLL
jgi:glycosyltransferase involved in cell wall biosynthesis